MFMEDLGAGSLRRILEQISAHAGKGWTVQNLSLCLGHGRLYENWNRRLSVPGVEHVFVAARLLGVRAGYLQFGELPIKDEAREALIYHPDLVAKARAWTAACKPRLRARPKKLRHPVSGIGHGQTLLAPSTSVPTASESQSPASPPEPSKPPRKDRRRAKPSHAKESEPQPVRKLRGQNEP